MNTPYPELSAGERATLEQFLELYRHTIVSLLDGLDDAEVIELSLPATSMSIGGIVKHLARVEDHWFHRTMLGQELPEPWASAPTEKDWDFTSAATDSRDELLSIYTAACGRSRHAAASVNSLDTLAIRPSFGKGPVSLRWVYVHMVDETARHAGHIDLMRDALMSRWGRP